jgi:hypothetical protein
MDIAHITIPFTVEIKSGHHNPSDLVEKEIKNIESMIKSHLNDDLFSLIKNPEFDGSLYEIRETFFRQIETHELLGEALNYSVGMIPSVMKNIKKDPSYMCDLVIGGEFEVLCSPQYMEQALRETKMDFFWDSQMNGWGAECNGIRIHAKSVELCIYRAWCYFYHGAYVSVPKKLSNGLGDEKEVAIYDSRIKR